MTQDMLIGQLTQLELFHWFVRAHLETAGGALSTAGEQGEQPAAQAAARGRVLPRLTDRGRVSRPRRARAPGGGTGRTPRLRGARR